MLPDKQTINRIPFLEGYLNVLITCRSLVVKELLNIFYAHYVCLMRPETKASSIKFGK